MSTRDGEGCAEGGAVGPIVQPERVRLLNTEPVRPGAYVLYWMQAAQRAHWNHALEYAILEANRAKVPVVACFGITRAYPGATLRHYRFMLEGLAEAAAELARRGIAFVAAPEEPPDLVERLAAEASQVVVDCGYTRHQRAWRQDAARRLWCRLTEVEGEVVVPVQTAYPKGAFSAAVLRPRLTSLWPRFMVPLVESDPVVDSRAVAPDGLDLTDLEPICASLDVDRSDPPLALKGGASEGRARLRAFIEGALERYPTHRHDPLEDVTSHLSPYLHFGQVSVLEVSLAVRQTGVPQAEAFLDELVVRRELACNWVWYNPRYDSFDGLPAWAMRTLRAHAADPRPWVYAETALSQARTHDPYWNAAQTQLSRFGWMHGYLRMYWGKKILEWSASPEEGFAVAVRLNDRFELDGRDPNGYAGVAWCFGAHDRPFNERAVFGAVRAMTASALRRTFDADLFVRRIQALDQARAETGADGPTGAGLGGPRLSNP